MAERFATLDALLEALRAAAEPSRLRLLALCAEGELTVSELTQILGQSQPRVSRHLKLLCDAGLLDRVREGSWAFFRLARDGGQATELAERLAAMIPSDDPQAQRDRARLEQVRAARAAAAQIYFSANAGEWNALRGLHADEAAVEAALVAALGPVDGASLLDLGAGTGRILALLGPRLRAGVGVDLSREMLAVARVALERAGLPHCAVRQGDLMQLPFADATFDAVTIHQVLHYLDDPAAALAEAARVLRPGGRLVVADFAPHAVEELRRDHAHRRLGFAAEEVAAWLADVGLAPEGPRAVPGGALTVLVWAARRPDADRSDASPAFVRPPLTESAQ